MSRDKTTFSPLAPIEDRNAAIYFGHLAAQAEAVIPNHGREAQVALTWLAAHVSHEGARVWRARFDDLVLADQQLGSWVLTARLDSTSKDVVEIARREWLAEDGRQIMALAHPFLDGEVTQEALDRACEKLVDFSAALLAPCLSACAGNVRIRDMNGHEVTVSTRRIREIKIFGKKVSL